MLTSTSSKPTSATPSTSTSSGKGDCCGKSSCSATHDQIAKRAYDLYVAGGSTKGHCAQNWAQAEHDLSAMPAASSQLRMKV